MAVLNIRVEDHVRDILKGKADDEGVTISEYVRDLLMAAIIPVGTAAAIAHGDEPAPETMSLFERQVLAGIHRILAHVVPEDGHDEDGDFAYQIMRAKILEEGYTGQYWFTTAGFSTELSKHDCERVIDVLDMFRIITYSVEDLAKAGTPIDDRLRRDLEFEGFDHNDALEGHMASYVRFLMSDERKWEELRPQLERHDNGNSHTRMLGMYDRMLAEYRRILDSRERGYRRNSYLLSPDELAQIKEAQPHPSNRQKAQD